ncbi:MAG: methylenetetrahydrofolate reductase [Thermoprotei archaeon]
MSTEPYSKEVFYEVTPPSKRSTKHELDDVVRNAIRYGCFHIDVTDSPTGEEHSSSVAASVYLKTVYPVAVICHVRTRDHTIMGLTSLIRACLAWDVEKVLFVMGEGEASTGVRPSEAIRIAKRIVEHSGSRPAFGLVYDPNKPQTLERKMEAQPDFLYSGPITSEDHLSDLDRKVKRAGIGLVAGIMPASERNQPIFKRIGVSQMDFELYRSRQDSIASHVFEVADSLTVMSPADEQAGLILLNKLLKRSGGT